MPVDLKKFDVRLSASTWDRLFFRVEHWLLSAGGSDMAKLRGYLRVKNWRNAGSPRERLHAIKVLLKLPAHSYRESVRAVAEYGDWVTREFGVSRGQQVRQLWWLRVRHGIRPAVYYRHRLFRPGELRRAPQYFQGGEAHELYRLLSVRTAPEEAAMMVNKAQFERWLVAHGFPTTRTILELAKGSIVRSTLADGALPRLDLFSKPADEEAGAGTGRWSYDGEGWVGVDGRRRTERELIAELSEQSLQYDVLVQEHLRIHPALAPLAPAALSTVRLLTLRGLDGTVRLLFAVAKIPTGRAATDHMKHGGLGAPIDLATGCLQRAVRKDPKTLVVYCDRHPDTGAAIEGFQLPHWESTKQLVVRAHEALERLVCIGWDVAILESGPVIVEGNENPGSTSTQTPTGVPLGETPVAATLVAHLRAALMNPAATPPRAAQRNPGVPQTEPVRPPAPGWVPTGPNQEESRRQDRAAT
jgi:hypothetical protein